jgi:hypothetical protein
MGINLNFSGVENAFAPVPEGDYTLVISDVKVEPSKNVDKPSTNIILDMVVSGGESDGKQVRNYLNVQESTMWRVKEFFVALTGDEDLEEFDLDDESVLIGQTIGATLSVTEDGKYNSVEAWFSA